MITPLFSIILPTYNRVQFIPEAIKSVLAQQYVNWELIIIDDGSTDDTKAVVSSFSDSRIKYFYQQNLERSVARNNGVSKSSGDFICFLDSDDYFLQDHLKNFNDILKHYEYQNAIYFCNIIEDIGSSKIYHRIDRSNIKNALDVIMLNSIGVPQCCISRKILDEEKFDENIKIGEDRHLWYRIGSKYPIYFSDHATYVFQNHSSRTVGLEREVTFLENLSTIRQVIALDKEKKSLSQYAKQKALSKAYYNLARHYEFKGKKIKMFKALLISLTISRSQFKTKIFMFLSNTPGISKIMKYRSI